ncbi:MAG TPA: TIGR02530 family flagellar biosynthesis protein [Spirochaetia bacterium]|nr:TIGR02530 family flagellar biosynthesis protein [Spirochaetia bacterium]
MKVEQVLPGLPAPVSSQAPVGGPGGFSQTLQAEMEKSGLKFSAHAQKRLRDRSIDLGGADLDRLNQALDQAQSKGVKDTLLIYGDLTLVASVTNRTVVTALEGGEAKVFTNIDGAVIVPR